ncbi:MAG TPA: DUF4139 domain-containing protein [Planctomycetota bacterium]|nr:DUF4139 domain-containing protein [Planctomycetota bacterium]
MARRILAGALVLGLWASAPLAQAVDEKDLGPGVSLTVYNQNFAVIKERRLMDLQPGRSWVKFMDVASKIDATSVAFSSLTDPLGTKVLEQNYEFDLVSASKLLEKYIDKDITIITKDGDVVEGKLMSSDAAQIVLKREDGGIAMVPRERNVRDIIFGKLPEGLLTKPTLVWQVQSARGGRQLIKVAYMTTGMSWRSDYTLELMEKGDAIDWAGWVTVNNQSGTRYVDAGLKLMAGDVHRVVEERLGAPLTRAPQAAQAMNAKAREVVEKAFAEYHLYTVTAPSTLNDQQTKQIEFVKRSGVPVQKKYYYRGSSTGWWQRPTTKVNVEVQFKNSKENNMGVPLPAGVVRLYKRDWEGELHMLGQTRIDHTPKDEELKFEMGNAFDLIGERKVVAQRRPALRVFEEDIEILIRNHKTVAVTVGVEEVMYRYAQWRLLEQNQPGRKKDFRTMVWPVKVDANDESKLTYTVRYNW